MDGSLKYWLNGEPVLPDTNLGSLKYWQNGEPYIFYQQTTNTNISIPLATQTFTIEQPAINVSAQQNTITVLAIQSFNFDQPNLSVVVEKNVSQNLSIQAFAIEQSNLNVETETAVAVPVQNFTVVVPSVNIATTKNSQVNLEAQVFTFVLPSLVVATEDPQVNFYNIAKKLLLNAEIDFINDTIKGMLVNSNYTFDKDNHKYKSDITDEISGTGYTAGGKELTNKTIVQDNTNDLARFDADDLVWTNANFTCHGLILYKDTGLASTSPLIFYANFGSDQSPNNNNFEVIWDNTNGIFTLHNL